MSKLNCVLNKQEFTSKYTHRSKSAIKLLLIRIVTVVFL